MKSFLVTAAVATSLALVGTACGGNPGRSHSPDLDPALKAGIASLDTPIVGGGASFPDAFYQAANTDFNDVAGRELVTYAKTGSADGRAQLGTGTLDFAGSDSLPSPSEVLPSELLFFPTVAAPITISYNLPGVADLSVGPDTLARIFQGDIVRWNAPEIASENGGVELPDLPINVVHRSDGSGTTRNLTSFLAAASPEVWRLGSGDEVAWPPTTQGAEKNSGVAEVIRKTSGAVGYVDLGDAAKAGLRVARVRNAEGEYVRPTAAAVTAALEGSVVDEDLTFDPLNAAAPGAYPITAPTWLLVSARQTGPKAMTLKSYLRYLLGPAQSDALALGYVPLPDHLRQLAVAQIERISP